VTSQENITSLLKAVLSLKNEDEVQRFIDDLCTPKEIHSFTERWAIARLLHEGQMNYRDIASNTGASTATVTRVARFLNQERNKGYKIILERMGE